VDVNASDAHHRARRLARICNTQGVFTAGDRGLFITRLFRIDPQKPIIKFIRDQHVLVERTELS